MAQYKVPQDVEADDKLLGPFSFRQFVYLLIAGGCIALGVALFQIFPLLIIIPIIPALFFIVLALPLKKDQPMETYLAAIVSYYLKPRTRIWMPGQRESTISITAPKVVEDTKARDITGEEATHRLSFLADIVDTEGYAIKNSNTAHINDDVVAEANATSDMFETTHFDSLEDTIAKDENDRHREVVEEMREAIRQTESMTHEIKKRSDEDKGPEKGSLREAEAKDDAEVIVEPGAVPEPVEKTEKVEELVEKTKRPVEKTDRISEQTEEKVEKTEAKPSIIELANNADFSVATIAKEANRIKERDEGEVFISLH
ncbi:PrgI family protein [Candidatus Saccharibacteria bacterium]|nr:PrgI family protein [Candidatus Saccharibacteria bacterium]